ncbi:hypothetical protein DYB32_005461 [Aphanomyces invadans]|uniref:Protein kinase domain-containing protein n=1 Tax=Aphanomyces invadans TaxID=157072 RepID=A0A418AUG4_9STRA|nr:hypothetical protein DYB32_005461 [Aphanomyces invadans]
MTIDCPQLPQASTPKHEKAAFVRKVYTNYHNDNASNSTHAYLGDEVSVHGVHARGMTYPHDTAAPLPVYESIAEEEGGSHSFSSPSFDDNHHSILPSLEATAAERRPDVWVLSALQELPLDLSMQAMHKQGTSCAVHCWSHDLETKGFVYLRSSKSSPSTQWVRRFMVLYRNTLVEYLDESACRPIGFANVSEAEMALEDDGVLTVAVTASALRTQEWAVRLVEDGIERNDTLFREVLTQTVLTMRSRSTHESFVVQVISLFETHDHLVIEMELMHGGDVFDRIAEKGPMAERDAAVFISHLVQAIDFCFHNGVVHRDVKLSNLALDEGTEFGAAQRYANRDCVSAAEWDAPWTAGVVLYTLLCGYEPFFGRNDKELIALNKAVVYSFHPQEWAHISDHAKDLIQLMMQPDARDRITAQEALRHPFLRDIPVASFSGAMACTRLF